MSDEDSLRFWIIPVVSGVAIVLFLGLVGVNYLVNTAPLADQQYGEISQMDCEELENIPSSTVLYTPKNRKLLTELSEGCIEAENVVKKKQKELLEERLNDPNSIESLLKEYREKSELQTRLQKDHDYHSTEFKLVQQELEETNRTLSELQSHPNWSEALQVLNREE